MKLFKPKVEVKVTYCKRTGRTTTKRVTAERTAKRNIYKIMLDWNEWIEVEVKS